MGALTLRLRLTVCLSVNRSNRSSLQCRGAGLTKCKTLSESCMPLTKIDGSTCARSAVHGTDGLQSLFVAVRADRTGCGFIFDGLGTDWNLFGRCRKIVRAEAC